jgi:tripartite-type tricarboxylate transporter receptor subunit TctC
VPTVAESGLPGYQSTTNAGMFAPVRTPDRLIALLNREIGQVLNKPEARDLLFKDGTEVVASSPQDFAATIKAEMTSMGKVIKAAGIRTE